MLWLNHNPDHQFK